MFQENKKPCSALSWYTFPMAQKQKIMFLVMAGLLGASVGWLFSVHHFPVRTERPQSPAQVRDALSAVGAVPQFSTPVKALTVNHHLLADTLVAKMVKIAADQHPKLLVIFSPNHFLVGDGWMITSDFDWDTGMGVVKENHGLIHWLKKNTTVRVDERPFADEHGIFNLLPYIATTMPKVKILPIIFKDGISNKRVDALVRDLNDTLPADTLFIGSLDFSHYQTLVTSNRQDQSTLRVLQSLDTEHLDQAYVDSQPALRALMLFAKLRGAKSFQLVEHKNSADITGNLDATSTTSYIDGVFL